MHSFLSGLADGLPRAGFWESPAVVAVSGGADSVALLCGLVQLAPPVPRLVVAHACHDLRPEAGGDRDFVVALAAGLGLPCVERSLAVRTDAGKRGEGVEAHARRLRLGFFVDVACEHGARYVVLGHTADDQAETILHRALRGTGLAGLAGMRSSRALVDGIGLVRPLLHLPRALGRRFLLEEGTAWREDATNADPRFARNFLRHEILLRAARGPYPAAPSALVRLGRQAAAVSDALASAAHHLLELYARRQADGRIVLCAAPLVELDRHLVARLVVALWEREGWPQRDMTARHYETLADLIRETGRDDHPARTAIDLPAGVRVRPAAGRRVELSRMPSGTAATVQ